jgi:AbiTii
MTTPLIIQIRQAAMDSKSSVVDALRKAKVACVKLGLTDFGNWVDLELNGYFDSKVDELPEYRKLYGMPQAFNPHRGWVPLTFTSPEQERNWSVAYMPMPIAALEDSLREKPAGALYSLYPPEIQHDLRKSLNVNWINDFHIKVPVNQAANILHAVRNILLDWTLAMEKQGILGENLMFSPEERKRSTSVTAQTVNNFHIQQVASFVQNAENSVVQGGIDSSLNLTTGVRNLVQQVEQLLPATHLEPSLQKETRAALDELKEAANSTNPDSGRLRKGLETLKRVLAPAGEHLLKIAVDTAVTKLLGNG